MIAGLAGVPEMDHVLAYVRRHHLALIALFVAFGGTSYAAVNANPGRSGLIDGCYTAKTGALRVISAGKKCAKGQLALSWNQKGQSGPQGPAGAQGPPGQTGLQGPPGPSSGPAGGALTGTYPDPTIAPHAITPEQFGTVPAVSATNATEETFKNGEIATVTFNTNEFDTDGIHSTSTDVERLTAPIAGVYEVNFEVRWSENVSGGRFISIEKNDGNYVFANWVPANGGSPLDQSVSGLIKLNAGEYVNPIVYQNSGATLHIESEPLHFSMMWIGDG
jgi:hypothetical protein